MQDVVYRFTAAERAGIKRRNDEVLRFINAIAEIRELPDRLTISPDGAGLCLDRPDPPASIPPPSALQRSAADPEAQ